MAREILSEFNDVFSCEKKNLTPRPLAAPQTRNPYSARRPAGVNKGEHCRLRPGENDLTLIGSGAPMSAVADG